METLQKCTKCKKERTDEYFLTKTGRRTKLCRLCRKRERTYHEDKPVASIFEANKRNFKLRCRVDKLKLNYIITKHKEGVIKDIGGSFIQNKVIQGDGQLALLSEFYNILDEQGEMVSGYRQAQGIGRYYVKRKLGLQNLSRKIRHTIANELMYDIDMKNAHPVLLENYCQKNRIPCEHLTYYIQNRAQCFEDLKQWKGWDRDDAKKDTLAILNGRLKTDKQVLDAPEWYIDYYNNIRDIMEKVRDLNPKLYQRAVKSRQSFGKDAYNVLGTCMSYVMGNLENTALMHTYDLITFKGIEVAELCYDGMMIYKSSVQTDLNKLLQECSHNLKVKMDVDMVFTCKEMNEGFDIDNEVEAYSPKDIPMESNPEVRELFRIYETDFVKIKDIPDAIEYVQDIEPAEEKCSAIKAPMGRGKTSSITRYITKYEPQKVRVLSPRQSYANSIANEYTEKTGKQFVSYLNVEKRDYTSTNKLVMSMESLHYMNTDDIIKHPIDLLILDECQANLASHTTIETNGKEHIKDNILMLNLLLRTSKKIIIADAFLNCKTINFLTKMEIPTVLYNYQTKMEHRTAIEIVSEDLDALFYEIDKDLQQNKKLYCVVSSKSRLELWAKSLRTKHPNKNILTYTSGQGKNILDVRKEWGPAHCVLTTTTITVGINYDIPDDFHKVFISASARAKNNVVNLFQAHYRVRHLIDKELVFHLYDKPIDTPTINKQQISIELEQKEKLILGVSEFYTKASDTIKQLIVDNTHEYNLSSSKMSAMFYKFLMECNYDYQKKEEKIEEEEDWEIEEDKAIPFVDIPIITNEEYKELNNKRRNGDALTELDKCKADKYVFIKTFTNDNLEDWVNNGFDEVFWQTWVNYKRVKIRNIKTEKKVRENRTSITELHAREAEQCDLAVMHNTKIIQAGKVIELCGELGLDISSQHLGCEVNHERMFKVLYDIRKDNGKRYRELFNIRDQRKDKTVMSTVNCISLLNTIFKNYGFTKLKPVRKQRMKVENINKQVSIYALVDNVQDICKDVKVHPESWKNLGERIYNSIKLPEEKRLIRLLVNSNKIHPLSV